jgi:hypothetical protein
MKKIFEYLLPACFLAFLLFPYSCDKTQEPIEPDPTDTTAIDTTSVDTTTVSTHIIPLGQSYVLLNDVPWQGKLKANYISGDKNAFRLSGQIFYNNLRSDLLTIHDIPALTGTYNPELYWGVNPFINMIPNPIFSISQDIDQPVGYYQIDTSRNDHFIEILRIDTVENIVEGRFQLFMPKEPSAVIWNPAPPEYISLTEGKFHLKIKEM